MSNHVHAVDWTLLVGYPLEEAEEVLREEGVDFELLITSSPRKTSDTSDLRVIAVQTAEKVRLVCGTPDWSVN